MAHPMPLLSLNNAYNTDELMEFDRRVKNKLPAEPLTYVGEQKIDGLTVALPLPGRGFGPGRHQGRRTCGARMSPPISGPSGRSPEITGGEYSGRVLVRGEVFMTKDAFQELNRERERTGQPLFANPRQRGRRLPAAIGSGGNRRPPSGRLLVRPPCSGKGRRFRLPTGRPRTCSRNGV